MRPLLLLLRCVLISYGLTAFGFDEEKALLAAIVKHPQEDTPRLAYADWLEEHGQANRADFIRIQIERARTDPDDRSLGPEAGLLTVHEKNWIPTLLVPYLRKGVRAYWVRGFIEHVEVFERLLKQKEVREGISEIATLRAITIGRSLPQPAATTTLRNLGRLGNVRQIESLNFAADVLRTPTALRALAALPLDSLRALDGIRCRLSSDALSHFSSATFSSRLTTLGLARGNQYLRDLVHYQGFPALEDITVRNLYGLHLLEGRRGLQSLHSLTVDNVTFDDGVVYGFEHFAPSTHSGIREVRIHFAMGRDEVSTHAAWPGLMAALLLLPNLTALEIRGYRESIALPDEVRSHIQKNRERLACPDAIQVAGGVSS